MMTRNRPMSFRRRSSGFRTGSPGTRNRLNQGYATGSLILAAFIGLVFNSWWGFGAAAAILLGLNLMGGQIRLAGSRR